MSLIEFIKSGLLTAGFVRMFMRVTTPILLASTGSIICDRAGVTNIGLEGVMLFSALSGVLVSSIGGCWELGLLAAILTGVAVSLLFGYFVLILKTPKPLCSLAINTFGAGGTIFVLYMATGEKGNTASLVSESVPVLNIPAIEDIPVLGPILSGHNLLTYVAFISVFLVYFMLFKTPLGLYIRTCGENDDAASSVGINVNKIRFISLALSGALAGAGGAFMSMGYMNYFVRDMTAGRGFIALAAEATGRAHPLGVLLSSLLFGFTESFAKAIQSLNIPGEILTMIPYAATLFALISTGAAKQREQQKRKEVCMIHDKNETLTGGNNNQ